MDQREIKLQMTDNEKTLNKTMYWNFALLIMNIISQAGWINANVLSNNKQQIISLKEY